MIFYLPDTVVPSFIAGGPDGNLWFTEPTGKIGRLTPKGALTEFPIDSESPSLYGTAAEADAVAPRKDLLLSRP